MTEIVVKADAFEVARFAAETFVSLAGEAIGKRGRFTVALSGGSTPKALYRLLSSEEFRDRVDWQKVLFFFGDERNVPPDSEESNFRMAKESLFDPLAVADLKIFRWETECGNAAEVAAAYAATIEQQMGSGPVFDLVLLGLGPDAHTASLFPHSAALNESVKLAVENWIEKFEVYRLTMTFPIFNSARCVMFLVAGADKQRALVNVLEGEPNADEFPAQSIKPRDGALRWVLDQQAAALLSLARDQA